LSDAPQQLGKYQIRRAIGKGAMGIVYEGFDPVIDRIVAIKTIKKDELDPEEAEEHSRRFLIEAKAAGRLNHKNIVGIYDYGEEKGLSFIVMEFVQGKELKSFFAARHPFSMSQIARLMGELLDALGYSHSRGVVHRDVKPDNIFITNDGSVKLGDFGIARIDSTSKTHAGTVLGTPSYMAPEQIRGETADARSDLYAAGVILYQFLVGERPFSGGMVAVMQKVLMETPKAPSAHNPSIPETIDNVVMKALAKAPDARFASAAEFNRELTAAVGLSTDEDESESTMIMSPAALKALQEAGPTERTGTGTGGTHTGTGTGTGGSGRSMAGATGGRAGAVEEAKRRAEEAKRRYEEDLKRAEAELQQAEEEQRAAEAEAQAHAARALQESQALLDESAAWRQGGEALFAGQALLVDGADSLKSGRALSERLRASAGSIAEFVEASYALSPAGQAELVARQQALEAAAASQEALAVRIEHEAKEALSGIELKLEVLEHRLAGQDGAWGAESRLLEALDPDAGDAPIAPIRGRLDKLAASVEQVGKGFASIKARPLRLPERQAQRVAVIEAQLEAQGSQVARLRSELEGARARVKAAAEARRVAEEAARKAAEQAAREKAEQEARRQAEEEARLKAEAEKKRRDEEEARRQADEAERQRKEAEARARAEAQAAEKKRLAEEKTRQEAEARRQSEEAAARKKADEEAARKKAEDEARAKADAAARLKSEEDAARRKAEADAKRVAEEQARLKADEDARKKAAAREAAAKDAAAKEAAAKEKATREKADFEARRKADEEAARLAGAARASDDAEATMVAPIRGAVVDDAETTMLRPIEPPKPTPASAPPTPTPAPTPTSQPTAAPAPSTATSHAPTPSAGRNKLLLPIAGVAVVAVVAGAWLATRSGPQPGNTPVAASAPVVTAAVSESAPPAVAPPPVASAPVASPVVVAQADTASAPAAADPQSVDAAAQRKAEEDAQKKAEAEAAKKAKAEEAARRKAEAASAADAGRGGVDADTEARALQRLNQGTRVAEADTANARPPKSDPRADAAALFRKGYEAYLAGNVPEGVRTMERADAQGAPGARARLCAIYRKPTAAEGKDFLKEANKCKGID
jgi:hypothetical protein